MGKERFKLVEKYLGMVKKNKNTNFFSHILWSLCKAGAWMYHDAALSNIKVLIKQNKNLINCNAQDDDIINKQRETLIDTLVNIRGRFKNEVDDFLDTLLDEVNTDYEINVDGVKAFINEIKNSPMKFDMGDFRAVYGQLVYFKVGIFYPDCKEVFSLALEEAIDTNTVEEFFYCFVDKFSPWLFGAKS